MSQNFTVLTIIGVVVLVVVLYKLVKPMLGAENQKNGEDLFISPNDIYEQVRLMISNGNHPVAQKLAKKYLKENPKHDKLRVMLARSCYDTSSLNEAIEHLEILINVFPDRIDLYNMLADSYKRTGQSNNAIDTYLALLETNPDSVDILLPLAELYSSVNHKKSALNIYKRLLNLDIKEFEKIGYYYQVASIYKDLCEYENAIEYVIFGLNTDKNNIKLLYLYKDLCSITKNVEKEIEVMNRLLVLAPTDAYLQSDLVNLYFQSAKYDEALDIAIPALNTPSADIESLQNIIAKIYIKTNKIEQGINVLENIIQTYPESIRLTETLAYAYRLYGQYEKSVELYRKLVDWADIKLAKLYNNDLSSVYCDWALYLYNIGQHSETFEKFDEALRLNPDNPDIYEGLGRVNFLAKNYSDAIRQMQKAIEVSPKNADYYIFLADIYWEINNVYEAERMYRESILVNPENSVSRAKLGKIKVKQKDIQTALEHLSIAVKLEPENWDYLYNLALVYELSSDKEKAISTYNRVLMFNPEHKEAMKNLKMLENSK